jgi:hypothetical protein
MRKLSLLSICVALVAASVSHARQSAPSPQAAVKYGFDEVAGWLTASAELVPADKYAYKPVNTVRSFGELMAHAADGMNWFCGSAKAPKDIAWSDAVEKAGATKAKVVAALKQSIQGCNAAHASATARFEKLMANVAHSNLHYGNVITYLRMLGLKPPSS